MRKIFTFFFFFVFCFSINAQVEEVRRITKTLCSPGFHGRGYVNSGDSIAASFIADEFKKIGLKPLKRSYFQVFSLDVNTFPGKMEVRIGDKSLIPGVHYLVNPSSNEIHSILKPKQISFTVILNKEELIKEVSAIVGRKSEYNSIAINFKGASADTLKLLTGIPEQLAAILPVIEITDKKLTWSVGRGQYKNAFIQVQDSIYRPEQSWSLDIDSKFIQQHISKNVIAYLPSKKRKAKTIVFTAHYDHLGRMGQANYFPGGNDNASGTAMLLSIANYFKQHPSDYNILFIAFAGEEAGLVGSEYFVNHPTYKLDKMNFLINLDIMGSGEEGITVVNATNFEAEFNRLQEINEENKLLVQIKKRGPTKNSDHYWFTTKNVPAFFIYTQGPNKNYHDIFDTYENLSFVEYQDITSLLVKFVETFNDLIIR